MGTMWTTLAGLNWTTIAGVVGSVAPLITILIAVRALGSWKRTLRNQRIDECISAAYCLTGSPNRYEVVNGRGKLSTTAEAFDQLLTSFHDFDRAHTVVRRYRPDLDPLDVFHVGKIVLYLDYDDEGHASIEQRADGAVHNLSLVIDKLAPERPKETGALSRLARRLRSLRRRRRA
jgi:hypothetical protein